MPKESIQTQQGRLLGILGQLGLDPMVRLSNPVRRLFVLLAVLGGKVGRGIAAARLWPDQTDTAARSNLRRTLFQCPTGWIRNSGDEIGLDAAVDLDAARQIALRAVAGEPLSLEEIDVLAQDLLPGWHEEWLIPFQDRHHVLRVQALEAACRTLTASGQHALAVLAGSAALAAEPLNESAAEALILCHLAQRNRYQARRCYDALAKRLDDELGVSPDPALSERLSHLVARAPLIQ